MSVKIPPDAVWPAGFLGLTIPFFLGAHLFFMVFWLRSRKRKRALLSLFLIALGYPFLRASVSFSNPEEEPKNISVMSYNARVFNLYQGMRWKEYTSSVEAIAWAASDSSDVKCFQEFYNDRRSSIFNTEKTIGRNRQYYSFVQPVVVNRIGAQFGLAIFSKYPIVNQGAIDLKEHSTNSAIFADIKVGDDTLRFYNAHLESLNFERKDIEVMEDIEGKSRNIARRLKSGFIARAKQVRFLSEHIAQSPHPVILCCDLNETPYSYAYFSLIEHLQNTFESKGNGFGFSYNGPLFFIRIDHQFHSPSLRATRFETLREVTFSDHFPLKASYTF